MIVVHFILTYTIMSPEKLRSVYRLVLITELLLAVTFITLPYIALRQEGLVLVCEERDSGQSPHSIFYQMVGGCAIPYWFSAASLALVAIWAAYKQTAMLILFPSFLVFTAGFGIVSAVWAQFLPDIYCGPLLSLSFYSSVSLMLTMIALGIDKGFGDNLWQSLGQYRALGNVQQHTFPDTLTQ
jgi:hypothetical protein